MTRSFSAAALAFLLLAAPQPVAALETDDLLAVVAMPLAVAAVSEVTDVPMTQLMDVVAMLNDADVPPVQFVEVVRYVPVALVVENDEQPFVDWLRLQQESGIRSLALVNTIEERFRVYDLQDIDFDRPQPDIIQVVESTAYVPPIVRTRVASRSIVADRDHPHGGPPGQLKKTLGVQTGAEVVHRGATTRRDEDAATRVVSRVDDDRKPAKPARASQTRSDQTRAQRDAARVSTEKGSSRSESRAGGGDAQKQNKRAAKADGGSGKGNGKGNGKGKNR